MVIGETQLPSTIRGGLAQKRCDGLYSKALANSRRKQIVHRHRPSGNCWFSFRNLSSPPGCKRFGIACSVDSNHVVVQKVDVPDDQGSGSEIIGALLRHLSLSPWSIVAFAANFDGKNGRAREELHSDLASVEGSVRAERFAMWEIDDKGGVVSDRIAYLSRLCIVIERYSNLSRRGVR